MWLASTCRPVPYTISVLAKSSAKLENAWWRAVAAGKSASASNTTRRGFSGTVNVASLFAPSTRHREEETPLAGLHRNRGGQAVGLGRLRRPHRDPPLLPLGRHVDRRRGGGNTRAVEPRPEVRLDVAAERLAGRREELRGGHLLPAVTPEEVLHEREERLVPHKEPQLVEGEGALDPRDQGRRVTVVGDAGLRRRDVGLA